MVHASLRNQRAMGAAVQGFLLMFDIRYKINEPLPLPQTFNIVISSPAGSTPIHYPPNAFLVKQISKNSHLLWSISYSRRSVSSDIQTPRSELKKRSYSRGVWISGETLTTFDCMIIHSKRIRI